jgi:16S rRNA (cytosine1402-N4)-methyltransferase
LISAIRIAVLTSQHVPVLLHETLQALAVHPGGRYIDATVGGGGHSAQILCASAPNGMLLALDADAAAVMRARARFESEELGPRVTVVHTSFVNLGRAAREHGWEAVDGIVLDLGLSSDQLADEARGFSFMSAGLDMRFDPTRGRPASALVNQLSISELADLLYRNGEERASRRIALAIAAARPIQSAQQLADVVARAARGAGRQRGAGAPSGGGKIHPATQTFQALRIAVNDELGVLELALPQAVELLMTGGRLAIITFHSLEDRIVKHFFRTESRDCICPPEQPVCNCGHRATVRILTTKPVRPSANEVADNPRARSAKLRAIERL